MSPRRRTLLVLAVLLPLAMACGHISTTRIAACSGTAGGQLGAGVRELAAPRNTLTTLSRRAEGMRCER